MRKKPAAGVLVSLRAHRIAKGRVASSLAEALLDGCFAHPAVYVGTRRQEKRVISEQAIFPYLCRKRGVHVIVRRT